MNNEDLNRGASWFYPLIMAAITACLLAGSARGDEPSFRDERSFTALSYTEASFDNGAVDGKARIVSIYTESRLNIPARLFFRFSVGDGQGPLGDDRDIYSAAGGVKVAPWDSGPLRFKVGYQAGSVGLPDIETGTHLTLFGSDSSWFAGAGFEWEEIELAEKTLPVPIAIEFYFTGPGKPPTFARGRGLCVRVGPLQYCLDEINRDAGGKGKVTSWTWGHKLGEPWPWSKKTAAEQLKADRLARFVLREKR